MRALTVRLRLLSALALLAVATLTVGAVAWVGLTRGADRLDRLHGETLLGVDRALTLSRHAAELAALAPYLLTLDSPYRIAQEGVQATALLDAIARDLAPDASLRADLDQTRSAIAQVVRETSLRAGLRDRTQRLNAEIARAERYFAGLAARLDTGLTETHQVFALQRVAAALLGAGRAENLIGVGEFQREYVALSARIDLTGDSFAARQMARLRGLAEGQGGLFELRRLELARQIGAEAALVRIRQGTAAVTAYAEAATTAAQAEIADERARATGAIALAKSTILLVGAASAVLALAAALYVSGHVTANLRAISDAMIRLAGGDRNSRLPRGAGQGDEIGKLFHAFRVFRANALRLDRSHRQMAQRNALFDKMLAGISDGVAILSETGQIVASNARLAQVLRVEPALLADRARLDDVIAQAGWQVAPRTAGYATLTLAGGPHAERRDSPLPGGGAVVLVADTTERQQMDDRLRQIQRIEALGKVSGEVAHDFGNILSTISGSLHLMESAPPARQDSLRSTIASAVDLGMSLTGRLLSFAKRQHLDPEVVDIAALTQGMEDLVGFALRDGITLDIVLPDAPLPVRVDPGQLESALLNLCLNAGQAIEGDGHITIRVRRDSDSAVIEVCDTGIGMPPEVLAHAMEPFFTARADGGGTGLGLAMVYGFMRQSGGDVQITSAPGAGTTVRLSLPLEDQGVPALPALGRVLLVEDDKSERAQAQALLAPACAALRLARTRDSALAHLGQPVDLVITDLRLHGRADGWDLARAVLDRWPDARAVVMSGNLPQGNPLAALYPGRVTTLAKPVTQAALVLALDDLTQPAPPVTTAAQ